MGRKGKSKGQKKSQTCSREKLVDVVKKNSKSSITESDTVKLSSTIGIGFEIIDSKCVALHLTIFDLQGNIRSLGTGFLYKNDCGCYLVTAKHVLCKSNDDLYGTSLEACCISFREYVKEVTTFTVQLCDHVLMSKVGDIALIPLGNVDTEEFLDYIEYTKGQNTPFVFSDNNSEKIDESMIGCDIYTVGYTSSLAFQFSYLMPGPFLRKGIISRFLDTSGKILLDCFSIYGNSGAPVFLRSANGHLLLIGFISQYAPYEIEWRNDKETGYSRLEFYNSGFTICIPINKAVELI